MFCKVVTACTCAGEVTDAPFAGVDTQTDPADVVPGVGGGVGAGLGNAATPVVGPALSVSVTAGQAALVVPGPGVGAGFELPGVGAAGVLLELDDMLPPPQAISVQMANTTGRQSSERRMTMGTSIGVIE